MSDPPVLSGGGDSGPRIPRGLWRSIFGWDALFRWDVLAALVPGIFIAVAGTMLGLDWFPHNLLISQVCCTIAVLLVIAKTFGEAVRAETNLVSKILFSVSICIVTGAAGIYVLLVIQAHKLTIIWYDPEPIEYGTTLSGQQLNAMVPNGGTLVYKPASGTKLPVGRAALSATFTPIGILKYFSVTKTVTLVVKPATVVAAPNSKPSSPTTKPQAPQACIPPPTDPTLTFVFKPPLVTDLKHQCQIQTAIIPFKQYLGKIGFNLLARTLPIGVTDSAGYNWVRGYGKYKDYLLIGVKTLDDRAGIVQAYASFAVLPNQVEGTTITAKDRAYWAQAHLSFAYYFSYSFLDQTPPDNLGNDWVKAFWQIRSLAGQEFTDTLIALAVNSFQDSPDRRQNIDFETYMDDRLGDAENLADGPQYSNRAIIGQALIKYGLFRYTPPPETKGPTPADH